MRTGKQKLTLVIRSGMFGQFLTFSRARSSPRRSLRSKYWNRFFWYQAMYCASSRVTGVSQAKTLGSSLRFWNASYHFKKSWGFSREFSRERHALRLVLKARRLTLVSQSISSPYQTVSDYQPRY